MDQDISGIAPHTVIDHGIFYIPQELSLFVYMSVENNLSLPLEHLSRQPDGPTRADIKERFEDMFTKFPVLRERRRAKAGELSGGQQKMIEFAKAYLVQPRLCLIDEPIDRACSKSCRGGVSVDPALRRETHGDPARRS